MEQKKILINNIMRNIMDLQSLYFDDDDKFFILNSLLQAVQIFFEMEVLENAKKIKQKEK